MGEVVLASCVEGQGILATDLRSGAVVASFEECSTQANGYGMLPASGLVFAAHEKKALWFAWAWGEKKPRYRGSLPEKMTSMVFSQDGTLCFAGAVSGSIYVWQTATGCLLRCWPAHVREVRKLVLSQDQCFLVTGSADANVHVFLLADIFAEQSPKPVHSWSGHSLPVTSLTLLPGSGMQQAVASASMDHSVRIWDVGTGRQLSTRSFASPVHCISSRPSGSEILCALKSGELRSFSTSSAAGVSDGVFTGHTGPVMSCAFNADGSQAASCSEVDCVRIWELRTRQCVSQAHASRNVQIGSVQILQRSTQNFSLPPLQPFQRMLRQVEDMPDVPVCGGSTSSALRSRLEEHTDTGDFIERVLWARASSGSEVGGIAELTQKCAAAEAKQARWASVALDLYGHLVDAGLDGKVAGNLASPAVDAAAPASAASAKEAPAKQCEDAGPPSQKRRKR